MKALVYQGIGAMAWQDVDRPELVADTDAIVQVDTTTIWGTDLHILKGDMPLVTPGRILGHEAVGTVTQIGRCEQGRSAWTWARAWSAGPESCSSTSRPRAWTPNPATTPGHHPGTRHRGHVHPADHP